MKKALLTVALLAGLSVSMAATPKDTFVWLGFGADPVPDFDPTQQYDTDSSGQLSNMYEPLYGYKGNSIKDFEPLLATAAPVASNGGKTYTIALRRNVKFHSGNTMTCEDAEYTFERALVTANSESWGGHILGPALVGSEASPKDDKSITWAKIDNAVSCNAQGNLVFKLVVADGSFPAKLAFKGASILDKKFTVGLGEWSGTGSDFAKWAGASLKESALQTKVSGTGPYTLVRKSPTEYVYKAFEGYWGPKKPTIQNVIYRKVAEEATMILAIQRGDADFATLTARASLTQLRNSPGVVILDDLPNVGQDVVFMNQNIKDTAQLGSGKLDGRGIPANFFSDVNVRKGFTHSFNYKQFIDQVQFGKAKMRTMPLPDTFFGYDATLPEPEYNLEKATAFFKRAWGGQVWNNGFQVIFTYNSGNTTRQAIGEILKANIERINPKFKINVVARPFGEVNSAAAAGKLTLRAGGWSADYADPDNFLPVFLSSTGYYKESLNINDKQLDQTLAQAASTPDRAKRAALYRVASRRAYDLAPFILIPAGARFAVVREELKGFNKDSYNPMMASNFVNWVDLSK